MRDARQFSYAYMIRSLHILEKKLNDKESRVRCEALHTFCALGTHAAPKGTSISECLQDEDWWVRKAAVKTLLSLGEIETETICRIGDNLTHSDKHIRLAAVHMLGKLAWLPSSAISNLAHAISNDRCGEVRAAAAESLGALGHRAPPAVLPICGALFDIYWKVSNEAGNHVQSIDYIGTHIKKKSYKSQLFICS